MFVAGIKVDPSKREFIIKLPIPSAQLDVRFFLGHERYYCQFIEKLSKLALPLFKLLVNEVKFYWDDDYQIVANSHKIHDHTQTLVFRSI